MTPSVHERREIAAVIGLVAAMAVCFIGCHFVLRQLTVSSPD